jgi:hypothetical protein
MAWLKRPGEDAKCRNYRRRSAPEMQRSKVSIQALVQSATRGDICRAGFLCLFQSTRSCRGRPNSVFVAKAFIDSVSIHALVQSATDLIEEMARVWMGFNPRARAERDCTEPDRCRDDAGFNPRARAERDSPARSAGWSH